MDYEKIGVLILVLSILSVEPINATELGYVNNSLNNTDVNVNSTEFNETNGTGINQTNVTMDNQTLNNTTLLPTTFDENNSIVNNTTSNATKTSDNTNIIIKDAVVGTLTAIGAVTAAIGGILAFIPDVTWTKYAAGACIVVGVGFTLAGIITNFIWDFFI